MNSSRWYHLHFIEFNQNDSCNPAAIDQEIKGKKICHKTHSSEENTRPYFKNEVAECGPLKDWW